MRKKTFHKMKGHIFGIALAIILLMLVLLVGGADAATSVNSCTTISSPGTYVLNQSIKTYSGNTCINITSNNVIFDGNKYTITGSGTGSGIYLNDITGATIRNLHISNFQNGIFLINSKNNNIANNTINSSNNGIYLNDAKNNSIANNIVKSNSYGIYLNDSANNSIYNNFFNNNNNVRIIDSVDKWNIAKAPGLNIIGGPYLGGNIWANPSGTGFSETCKDSDNDGICDSSYTLASKNIDYLPLAYEPYIWTITPPAIISFIPNSPVSDLAGATRFFDIILNQTVNVTWYINGTQVQVNKSVTNANYTNTSAAAGTWNVTSVATNTNGTAMQNWIWNVTKAIATVTLTNLEQTYTGSPLTPTAATNPPGLNIVWSGAPQTVAGSYPVKATVNDNNYTGSASGTFNITKASTSTAINSSANPSILGNVVTFTAIVSSAGGAIPDGETVAFYDGSTEMGSNTTLSGNATFSISTLPVGLHTINATYAGDTNFSTSTGSVMQTINPAASSPPNITSAAPASQVTTTAGALQTFSITINQSVNVTWSINGTVVQDTEKNVVTAGYTNTSASLGTWNVTAIATNSNGTAMQTWIWNVTSGLQLPPDPSTVAPPVDTSVATDIASSTEFLYTGSNPIQTGVANGTIDAKRVAVLRGRVLNRDGTLLPGVNISILSHPEFGGTLSRADGMFDMAVNGGGLLTVNYEKAGYLTAQRQVDAPWQDYAWLPDVVMIQADTNVTAIDLTKTVPIQVVRGSLVNDTDGAREATLLIPQGISANMTLPNGTTQPLTTMHVRATEYTVGASGPDAMPAELPPNSGYTYAVEFSVDEAPGASEIRFNQPIPFYLENFLNFSVGAIVPMGYYNRSLGQWIASDNGIVIKVLNITGGTANIDIDGSNQSANASQLAALNITDAERQQLATLYQPNQSLWRMPINHFSSWDANQGTRCKDNTCEFPNQTPPYNPDVDCQNNQNGSIIGCQNQVLGEAVGIIGTPFSLHYQSDRVPGRKADNFLDILLSGPMVPPNLTGIMLEISVAGQHFVQGFNPAPNQKTTFIWDGKDASNRTLQGPQPITVKIGYVYEAEYIRTDRFGYNGNGLISVAADGSSARQNMILWQKFQSSIGGWDNRGQGLGGWSLNVHNAYDPVGKVLYMGNGERRSAQAVGQIITTVAGIQAQLNHPYGVAVASDGSIYIADNGNNRILRVGTDGNITTVAGGGFYPVDGGPATQAGLNSPTGVAVGPDGSIYIADYANSRIRRVGTDGIITTVAGNGGNGYSGDGGPATQAQVGYPYGVAVAPDGSIYIASNTKSSIRRIGTDGIITTVAGHDNWYSYSGDGGPATQAGLNSPAGVAVGPDGSIYIADSGNNRIRRIGTDGIITTVAGNGNNGYSGDGGPATQAGLNSPTGVAVASDGSIYIGDYNNNRIRRVGTDGNITTVAGNGGNGYSGDGGPATQAQLAYLSGPAVAPDGSIYIVDSYNGLIRRVASALPGFSATDIIIPSDDGSEVYVFNSGGQHLLTLDALTGAVSYNFTYDSAGRLTAVTDGDGNVVTIERDAGGNATAIVSLYGQRTSLTLNANGYLASITNPAGESNQFSYTGEGLLTNMTDPRSYIHNFSYDSFGRLIRDEEPDGGFKTLNRTNIADGYFVTLATGLNRNTTYQVEQLSTGDQRRVNTFPDGLTTVAIIGTNGSTSNTYPDGIHTTLLQGPDPRFGMQAPVANNLVITTPSGIMQTIANQRTAVLTNPYDPMSLQTLTETFNINGQTFTSTYNASWKNITTSTPMGRTGVTTLDNKSRIVQGQVPGIVPVNFTYDARGRPSTISQGTRTYSFNYDAQGNLASVADPLSRTAGFEYDAAGRVTTQILPDGRQIQYAYDASGNVIAITPPGRPNHAFNYTPVDLIKDYTPPDIGIGDTSTRYTYNIDRQLTNVTRPDGTAINLGYDSAGRLSTVNYLQGTTSLSYDAATGNLKSVTAPDGGMITYAYDGILLTDTTWSGTVSGSVHRAYDNNFSITSESVNGANTVNFQYDLDGLLTQAGSLNLSRNPQNGMLTGSALGNTTDTIDYNSFGEMAAYQAAYNGTGIFSENYTRDDLGRIVQKNETIDGATHTYAYMYDQAGRLNNVSKDDVMISQYVYDANGNRLSYTNQSGTISGTYDNQDRLMQYGATTYNYTANGELLNKTTGSQTTIYKYDALGNLRNVTLPDGTSIEYVIDGNNNRIGKKVNGILVKGFMYDDYQMPIAELDGTGNVISRFVYASQGNVPDYMVKGGATYRIITDHIGSPRLVIDAATGTVIQRMDYDEFGNVVIDTNQGFQPFGFAGGIYDNDTRLVRFGARDYDSQAGRWLAKDPIGFEGGDTNLYVYVVNDPMNLKDITGKGIVKIVKIGYDWYKKYKKWYDLYKLIKLYLNPCPENLVEFGKDELGNVDPTGLVGVLLEDTVNKMIYHKRIIENPDKYLKDKYGIDWPH